MPEPRQHAGFIEWGVAGRPFPGEKVSGDRHAVVPRPEGMLVAVIDALGHGAAAESTARKASGILERHAGDPLPFLIQRCHEGLTGDRGAVIGAAVIDGRRGTMSWAGVGNVLGLLIPGAEGTRTAERLLAPPGIVGGQLPALRAESIPLAAGDLILLATDGLREGLVDGLLPGDGDLQQLAERLILDYATGNDDALVLIVRYVGCP